MRMRMSVARRALGLGLSAVVLFGAFTGVVATEPSQEPAVRRGDVERGRELFQAYTCYGCHGYIYYLRTSV